MLFVGLDVHWKQSTFCVLDGNGRHLRTHAVRGTWDKVLQELAKVKKPFAVCFEAASDYGYLYEHLNRIAQRVVVAHPGQLRLIFRSRRKSDRVDARKLAKLLFLDEAPPVYVPSADVRAWRGMIEFRTKLVAEALAGQEQDTGVAAHAGHRCTQGTVDQARHGLAAAAHHGHAVRPGASRRADG